VPQRRSFVLLAIGLVLLLGGIVVRHQLKKWEAEQDYETALTALELGRLADAAQLGARLAETTRFRSEGLLIAGEAAALQSRPEDALQLYRQVPQNGSRLARTALLAEGEILIKPLPSLNEAEQLYRRVLAEDPESVVAHERLAFILGIQGRATEAVPHRLALLRYGQVNPLQLLLLALGETADENPESANLFYKAKPDDPAALCAMARIDIQRNRVDSARRMLASAIRARPDLWVAQAWYGRLLLRARAFDEYARWHAELPSAADEAMEIWLVRAEAATALEQHEVAVRCYGEAVTRDPNHLAAMTGLARALQSAGKPDLANRFRARAKLLEQYATSARTHNISGSQDAVLEAAQRAAELGLAWESWGWYYVLNQSRKLDERESAQAEGQFAEAKREPQVRTLALGRIASDFPLAQFPLPTRGATQVAAVTPAARNDSPSIPPTVQATHPSGFRFAQEPAANGITLTFHNGHKQGAAGEYMYEFSGGAAAAIDYDRDGWSDLYFSQGTDWPPREDNLSHLDHLYRNRGDGKFENVAAQAGIVEQRFSQGVAVGDFDNDGFPDLYVANIGRNRLYRNNGDGTFDDVTPTANVAGDDWSTSVAIADLNHDSLPDIYVANYLRGEHLFTRPCLLPDGSIRLCTPHEFAAAQDRVYVNQGDGRFLDVTDTCGVVVPDGKALGLVIADMDDSRRLSVFTANDAVPNFLFANQTARPGDPPVLEERGFLAGVAVDGEGRAQACMGVAAGDSDGDGRLDIFVTNFRNEANTLYRQTDPLTWTDATRAAGLYSASFDLLGFGAQFLDADLDGDQDLMLVNGHVGDLSHHGIPYRMRPQFFENLGGGKFEERRGSAAGPYFEGEYLGRGLARLDWNRDGRPDLAVNHLSATAAIITNQTVSKHHFLTVRLVGTQSARDAIGAVVSVRTANGIQKQQLVAGDGYMASNERALFFGLNSADRIESVEVQWPSGSQSSLPSPAVDQNLWIVEPAAAR
jgi:tetratricopeptide (TPR) repeat protein